MILNIEYLGPFGKIQGFTTQSTVQVWVVLNLLPKPFTAKTNEMLLDEAAKGYVNHPRGVRFEDEKLVLSKIFDWYLVDFGGSTDNLIKHILEYSESQLYQKIKRYKGKLEYEYYWQLNEVR